MQGGRRLESLSLLKGRRAQAEVPPRKPQVAFKAPQQSQASASESSQARGPLGPAHLRHPRMKHLQSPVCPRECPRGIAAMSQRRHLKKEHADAIAMAFSGLFQPT